MSALDMRYGRQGGRVVPWSSKRRPPSIRICTECGCQIVVAEPSRTAHYVCDPTTTVGKTAAELEELQLT